MKRDMELVRRLLISIEEQPLEERWSVPKELEQNIANAHLELMEQAGLITLSASRTSVIALIYDAKITWSGHEYLSAIRSDTVWNKVKDGVKEKGLQFTELTFGVLKEYAVSEGRKMVGLE